MPDWPAFPDSAEALERLARATSSIILSNVDRASFAGSNKRLGVTFTSILTAQDIGSYKPSAAQLRRAARPRHDGSASPTDELLHVAQSLFHDHVPAKAVGLPTVWIDRRHDQPGLGRDARTPADVTPGLDVPSMAAFADAVDAAAGAARAG